MKSSVFKIIIPVLALFLTLSISFSVFASTATESEGSGGISYLSPPYVLPVSDNVNYAKTSIVDAFGTVLQNIEISLIGDEVTVTKVTDSISNPINVVYIPPAMEIGGYDYAITKIGNGALRKVGDMTDLILPSTIKEIGSRQFANKVSGFYRAVFLCDTPPIIGSNSLPEDPGYQYNLFVKDSAVEAFSKEFNNGGKFYRLSFLLNQVALDNANTLGGGETAPLLDDSGYTQKRFTIINYNVKSDLAELKKERFLPGIKGINQNRFLSRTSLFKNKTNS